MSSYAAQKGDTGATGPTGATGATGAAGAAGSNATLTMAEGLISTDLGTLTSASYVDLTGATVTINPGAVNIWIFAFVSGVAAGNTAAITIGIDIGGSIVAEQEFTMAATLGQRFAFGKKVTVTAGSKTIKLRFKAAPGAGGQIVINAASNPGQGGGIQVLYPVT